MMDLAVYLSYLTSCSVPVIEKKLMVVNDYEIITSYCM